MSEYYVVASDIGSGGCKTAVINVKGKVLSVAQKEYPTSYPYTGWVEQNPEDWYQAFCDTLRSVLKLSNIEPKKVLGVGIVGVTHNFVLLDKNDCPLYPSILLFDTRSKDQVKKIIDRWGAENVRNKALNDVTTAWSWPQLLWIRENENEIWRATRRLLFQKDYVRHRLTPSPVTDYIDAHGSLIFDPVQREWIRPFCDDLGLDYSWLPEVVPPLDVVAKVSPQGAADTGLAQGTPVIAGTTDTVAEVLGSGANQPGLAIVKLASVGRIAVVTTDPIYSPHILNYHHVWDDLWYPGTASKSAASSYRWLKDILWYETKEETTYQRMDSEAENVPPGCNGLLFHPHLMGEWAPHWNDQLRGDFIGLTARHNRAHLTRAVLEGVAFSLKDALSELEESGARVEEIRLIGQGAKSKLWSQIVTDVINRPIYVPEQVDAVYGAALITAMGIDAIGRSAEELKSIIKMRGSLRPKPDNVSTYATLFGIYRDSDKALYSISDRLFALDH